MEIPFRVEGQEYKDIKAQSETQSQGHAAERLVCATCGMQLEGFHSSATTSKICCPRCNTWMDIDPACFGSCIKCHKTRQNDASACATTSLANSKEEIEISRLVKGRSENRTLLTMFQGLIRKVRICLAGNKGD